MTDTESLVWVDGAAGVTITRINTQGGAAGIHPTLFACVNADFQQEWEGPLVPNPAPAPTVAQYQSVTQVATLLFTTTAPGVLIALRLPAPKLSIFLADGVTVDLANANVVALAAACVGLLSDDSGNVATALIAGHL